MFVVADEASAFHDPREGSLDDPAAAQNDEAGHEGQAADDFNGHVGLVLRPVDEFSSVASICEGVLDEWKAGAGTLENTLCAIAILRMASLNNCAVNLDGEESPVRIGQDVAFAPCDLLPSASASSRRCAARSSGA